MFEENNGVTDDSEGVELAYRYKENQELFFIAPFNFYQIFRHLIIIIVLLSNHLYSSSVDYENDYVRTNDTQAHDVSIDYSYR